MKEKRRPGGFQTFMFFLGFIVLFFLVFALGVIVGKGLDTEDLFHIKKNEKNENLLASSSVTVIEKTDVKKADIKKADIVVKKEDKTPEVKSAKPVKEDNQQKTAKKTSTKKTVKPVKQPEKKKVVVKEPQKTAPVKAAPAKNEKYVAKLDYSKPDFPVTDQGGQYTVQLGSFQNIEAAYNLEKKLLSKGYPCFVIKAAIPNKGSWYRVRVGTFQTKEKAVDYAEKLKKVEKLEYTQVTLNK